MQHRETPRGWEPYRKGPSHSESSGSRQEQYKNTEGRTFPQRAFKQFAAFTLDDGVDIGYRNCREEKQHSRRRLGDRATTPHDILETARTLAKLPLLGVARPLELGVRGIDQKVALAAVAAQLEQRRAFNNTDQAVMHYGAAEAVVS
jgi:hypothetical protein